MRKLCLVLPTFSTILWRNTESVIDDNQANDAASNPMIFPHLNDVTSESPRLLQSHDSAVDRAALATHRSLESGDSTVDLFDGKGQDHDERGPWNGILELDRILTDHMSEWKDQKLQPEVVAEILGIGRKFTSSKRLEYWMKYVHWFHHKFGLHYPYQKAYATLEKHKSQQETLKLLTSLRNVDDEHTKEPIAKMYNALASDLSDMPDMMLDTWKELNLHPKKVAEMLAIDQTESLAYLEKSAIQWLRYVEMWTTENMEPAIFFFPLKKRGNFCSATWKDKRSSRFFVVPESYACVSD